ncbi:hypothetical protein KZ779_17985 [Escherichia coli]|nr:hypothetical protein [Escherichia coli]
MTASAPKMEAFTFGEPVPVLDRRDILDYVECISNGRWYEPPVSFTGLAKKPACCRASQLTDLRQTQYSGLDIYPASVAFPAGFQPLCTGFSGVR